MTADFIFKQGQDHSFWAGRQFGAWLLHRKDVSASLEIIPPQWKGSWMSECPSFPGHCRLWHRTIGGILSQQDLEFSRRGICCHLTASSELLIMFTLFGILDLWLFLLWGRFPYFADGWRKFGFPCVQKTANCDFRWLEHFLSKSVWIFLFSSQLSSRNMLSPKSHLSFHAFTQFLRS